MCKQTSNNTTLAFGYLGKSYFWVWTGWGCIGFRKKFAEFEVDWIMAWIWFADIKRSSETLISGLNCTPKVGHIPSNSQGAVFLWANIHYTSNTKPYSTTCIYAANNVPQTTTAFPEPTWDDGYAPIKKAVSAHSNIPNPKPCPNTAKTPSSQINPTKKKHRQSLSKSCAICAQRSPT